VSFGVNSLTGHYLLSVIVGVKPSKLLAPSSQRRFVLTLLEELAASVARDGTGDLVEQVRQLCYH